MDKTKETDEQIPKMITLKISPKNSENIKLSDGKIKFDMDMNKSLSFTERRLWIDCSEELYNIIKPKIEEFSNRYVLSYSAAIHVITLAMSIMKEQLIENIKELNDESSMDFNKYILSIYNASLNNSEVMLNSIKDELKNKKIIV